MLERFKSRKFILAVVGGAVVFLNGAFDLGLNIEEVGLIVLSFLSFIGFEGIRDIQAK